MASKQNQKNSTFMKPMQISEKLAAVVGQGPMPRTEVTKKLWDYIKKHELQDPKNRRNVLPDDKLEQVFGTNKPVSMFQIPKLVGQHLS